MFKLYVDRGGLLREVRADWPDWIELRKAKVIQITNLYSVVSMKASQYLEHIKC